jgi:hypothetical protein
MAAKHYKLFFLLLVNFFSGESFAQCSSASGFGGSAFNNFNAIGSVTWANPGNALLPDGVRTTADTLVMALTTQTTNYLEILGFGFTLPSTANICGIEVDIKHRQQGIVIGSSVTDNIVQIVKGGFICGSNHALSTPWAGTDEVFTYGGLNDLWATSWTPADINSPNFGVVISANLNAGLAGVLLSAEIDYVTITIFHDGITLPVELTEFSALSNGKGVRLDWTTQTEKNNAYFEVERSRDAVSFEPVKKITGAGNSLRTVHYSWLDEEPYSGVSYYRLKQTDFNGAYKYSEVRQVNYEPVSKAVIFPSPASNRLTVRLDAAEDSPIELILLNGNGAVIHRYKYLAPAKISDMDLDVSDLAEGLYTIRVIGPDLETAKKIQVMRE